MPSQAIQRWALAVITAVFTSLTVSAQDPIQRASELLGLPAASLENVEMTTKSFPNQGITITAVKAFDRTTDEMVSIAVDQNGRRADFSALVRMEKNLRAMQPITTDVLQAMQPLGAQDKLPIGLWLRMDHIAIATYQAQLFDGVELSFAEAEARELEVARFAQSKVRSVTAPVAEALTALGLAPRYVSSAAPVLFIDATKDQILTLAKDRAIDAIYLERSDYADTNTDANRTHRTDRVHNYGVRGRNVDVAILENNGVDPACPHLVITDWFNPGTPNPDNHVHGTAGCVGSQLSSRLGAAPDARLYSANAATYSDSNVMAANDWAALTANVDITNMSYGGNYGGADRLMDRYYDYMMRTYQDSWVASAGNDDLANSVGSPGTAYNVITVGSFNEMGNADWADDAMSSFSSAADPASGCEKPNIAANGHGVDTLGDAGNNWLTDGYNGTSFSSPHAAGNLANAVGTHGTLNSSPEAAMAAVMATAWHNIEGASRLSEQDGAGGLHGLALFRLANDDRAVSRSLTTASFATNSYYTHDIYLQGGDRTRVCIAWSTLADSSYTTTTLEADLDLRIYEGQGVISGASFGGSSSFNNNFEIVEFTPVRTGWYTVRINDYRFDGTSERCGIAWSQKWEDTSYARLREDGTNELQPLSGPTVGTNNYSLDIIARGSPSSAYGIFASGTRGSGYGIDAFNWSPLDVDFWTQLQLSGDPSWVNMSGLTNLSGSTSGPLLRIQPVPQIVGFPLQHVLVTIDGGGGIKEIGEVHKFHFWPARTVITMSDDSTQELVLPFAFPFYGNTYNSVWINSNGNLTFGSGDNDLTESEAEFLADQPRIAVNWDDLEPDEPGTSGTSIMGYRFVNQGERHVVIEWSDIGEYLNVAGATGQNTMRAILWESGKIELLFNDMTLEDCITGISPGNGLSSNSPVDLSTHGRHASTGAIFEVFTSGANAFDLGGFSYWNNLTFTPSRTGTTYALTMDIE